MTFAIVFAQAALWVLATPIYAGPDEPAHLVRAASVARGELIGDSVEGAPSEAVRAVRVPGNIARLGDPACFAFDQERSAACAESFRVGEGGPLRHIVTTAGLHPPFYYVLVGAPIRISSTGVGFYATRTLSAALCAALIAWALVAAGAPGRGRFLVAGAVVAMTPTLLWLAALVNPSGLEVAAALSMWACGLRLVSPGGSQGGPSPPSPGGSQGGPSPPSPRGSHGGPSPPSPGGSQEESVWRWWLGGLAVGAVALVLARPIGFFWAGLIVLFLIAVGRRLILRDLLRRRLTWIWAGVVAVAAAAAGAWLLGAGSPLQPAADVGEPLGLVEALRAALGMTSDQVQEMIGMFGWLDTPAPWLVMWLWLSVLGALLVLALMAPQRRLLWVLGLLLAATVLVPVILTALQYNNLGLYWQGRYTLPMAVGIPLLAGLALDHLDADTHARARHAWWTIVIACALGHVVAFTGALRRFAVGDLGGLWFFGEAGWSPPLPALVLVGAFLASTLVFVWWLARPPDRPSEPAASIAPGRHWSRTVEERRGGRGGRSRSAP